MSEKKGPERIPTYNKRTLHKHILELFKLHPTKQFNYKYRLERNG